MTKIEGDFQCCHLHFFDARVFLFFSVGSEERFENWKVATKRLNRSGRRASAISAKHFWLVRNLKNIFFSKINLGPSWSFNQYLASIFDNFPICRKNAFWYQSWSFNTCRAFSISFYSALTGKSLADLKVKRDGEFEFDWFPTQLASRRTKGLNFSRTRRTVSVQFSGDWSWLESSQLEMSRRMNTELMRRLWIKLNCWPETVSLQKK